MERRCVKRTATEARTGRASRRDNSSALRNGTRPPSSLWARLITRWMAAEGESARTDCGEPRYGLMWCRIIAKTRPSAKSEVQSRGKGSEGA